MSHYREIKTEFKTAESIIKALKTLGVTPQVASNLRANTLEMQNAYGELHGASKVAIMVDHAAARAANLSYNGVGFAWDETSKTYNLVADYLPNQTIAKLKQRYSFEELRRAAAVKGYTVREVKDQNGVIRMTLTHS